MKTRKTRPYFTLLSREIGESWIIEFGAYDRDDVQAERDDMRDYDDRERMHRTYKIIRTPDAKQSTIADFVARLNMIELGRTAAAVEFDCGNRG